MRVFLSSVIGGLEPFRDAAEHAAKALRHEVQRAEDFVASASTPQQACLAGVRWAEVVVLLIGERYGSLQQSGLSATHEEYREAKERGPVLPFVQEGVNREVRQEDFLAEVQAWNSGKYTEPFSTPEELRDAVTRALHELALLQAQGPFDESEMLDRAARLLPTDRGWSRDSLCVTVVGGPRQQVLRPSELEDRRLWEDIQKEASYGSTRLLDLSAGTKGRLENHALILEQDQASVILDEMGSVRITQPALQQSPNRGALSALIEEDIREGINNAILFAGWILNRIDPVNRIADVVVAVTLFGDYLTWRTRAEHEASPNSMTGGTRTGPITVHLSPASRRRAALTFDGQRLAEDLTVLLRRELRPR